VGEKSHTTLSCWKKEKSVKAVFSKLLKAFRDRGKEKGRGRSSLPERKEKKKEERKHTTLACPLRRGAKKSVLTSLIIEGGRGRKFDSGKGAELQKGGT